MNDFREALARFRDAVRLEGEQSQSPGLQALLTRERLGKGLRSRWSMVAWAAAVTLMLAAIPAYETARRENAQQREREAEQERADTALLQQVNAGLSRSVPRAMAPLMDWAPAVK